MEKQMYIVRFCYAHTDSEKEVQRNAIKEMFLKEYDIFNQTAYICTAEQVLELIEMGCLGTYDVASNYKKFDI